MKKKGFTLVELLAVIVLLVIIMLVGSAGVNAVKDNINERMWVSTEEYIVTSAIKFGEDNLSIVNDNNRKCDNYPDGSKNKCLELTVQNLLEKYYLNSKETDKAGNKVIVDKRKNKDETNDENNYTNGYYINRNGKVFIYIEDEMVYAKYKYET